MNSIQPVAPGSLVTLVGAKTPIRAAHVECEACDEYIEVDVADQYDEHADDIISIIIDRECPKCHCDIYAVSCR